MQNILVIFNSGSPNLQNMLPIEKCIFFHASDDEDQKLNELHQFAHFKLMITFNGTSTFSMAVQKFIEQQHSIYNIPIIICPYALENDLSLPLLKKFHALEYAQVPHANHLALYKQCTARKSKSNDTGLFICDTLHPIMQNVQMFQCQALFREHLTVAKRDARLLAMWNDGVPMVAERNNCISLNFCLTNTNPKTDAKRILFQAIDYLLHKNYQGLQKKLYSMLAYRDVHIR